MYDPCSHALALGVKVIFSSLPGTRWGEYRHDSHTIVLRPGLTLRQARCTLAHELVHAEHRDQPTADSRLAARIERRADLVAAHRMIHPGLFGEAWSQDPHDEVAVASNLDVTVGLVRAYCMARGLHVGARG